MSGRKLKGAALEESYFESDEVVNCFNDLIVPLIKELQRLQQDVSLTPRDLSLLIGQLQRFQQDCLGAFNRPSNAPVRIPAKLLKVNKSIRLTQESPIYTILLAAYTYRIKHNWKKWDFGNPARKQKNAELMQAVRKALIKNDLISIPKIAIAEVLNDAYKKTILSLIKKVGAVYVEDKEEATHILHGKLHEYSKQGPEEDWFRTLEKDGPLVLVHWWYYPDSFDSWLPQTEQFADPEEPPEHVGPWKISVRWLQDTERFNEFMNEEDYEDLDEEEDEDEEDEEDGEAEEERLTEKDGSSPSRKRKASTSLDTDSSSMQNTKDIKQHAEATVSAVSTPMELADEEPDTPSVPLLQPGFQPEIRVRDIESEKPQANTRPRKNEFEPYVHGDIANISQYIAPNLEYPKRPTKLQKVEENGDDKVIDVSSLLKKTTYNYDSMHIPEWFDKSLIHKVETLSIPEINDDQSNLTPDEYINIRNFMIDTYRSNPAYYLTISTCSTKFEIDSPLLVRIHSFLEMQGLINSFVDPRRRMYDPYIDTDPNAQLKPKSQRHFEDIDKADMQYLRDLIYKQRSTPLSHSLWKLEVEDPKDPDRRRVFICCSCRSDCSEVRYQSLKAKDYQVCIDCFLEGRFPAVYSSADFIRVEGVGSADLDMYDPQQQPWTDDEILRLLEGVDRYDDDWLMISEHVGSRSKEQCITQFLQLPINDEFLTATLSEEELKETPFDNTANPVMMMIAFLAGHINPGVAAAASKAALKILVGSGEGHCTDEKADGSRIESGDDSDEATPKENADTTASVITKTEESRENFDDITDTAQSKREGNAMDIDKPDNSTEDAFSKETLKKATMAALKCAVQKAGKLADYEDQEIQHWTRLAVKTMVDKLALKVGQYEELENSLLNEAQELDKQQEHLASSIDMLVAPTIEQQQQLTKE